MCLGRKQLHQMIYNKLLNFKHSTRKVNKKQTKKQVKTNLNSEILREP